MDEVFIVIVNLNDLNDVLFPCILDFLIFILLQQ